MRKLTVVNTHYIASVFSGLGCLCDHLSTAQSRVLSDVVLREFSRSSSTAELVLVSHRVTDDSSNNFDNRQRLISNDVVKELIRNRSPMAFTRIEALEGFQLTLVLPFLIPAQRVCCGLPGLTG